ncbi:hypothetical protein N5933_26970 (plasmid) [Klebsiella pneumoniae]|uniref:hypothetical protein n=1 Tax=Klebsiella pneumoniae TaxID=573 RepID=UPI0021BF17DB|nr:hypothetical protein [Klebsiella pneumoniae]UXI48818.1 hypothetical protein N5933_26970 [Klebsiella pneumoniae]
MGEISVKTGNNARNGGKNSLNRLIRCVCGKKIGPDPRNFNQRVSLGRNDLLIRTFLYKPIDLELFRENIVSIQMNFLVNLWNLARFKPAYVRAYLALSNDAFQMLLDTEMSAFVEVTNVVLFPRFITYDTGRRDHKVYAWGYEIMADVLEGFIPRENMENLRVEFALKDSYEKLKLF